MIHNKLGFLLAFLFINNFQSQDLVNYGVDFNAPQCTLESKPAKQEVSIEELYKKVYECYFSWAAARQILAMPFYRIYAIVQPMNLITALLSPILALILILSIPSGSPIALALFALYLVPSIQGWNNPLAKAFINEIIKAMNSGKRVISSVPQVQSILDAIAVRLASKKEFSGYDKVSLGGALKKLVRENLVLAQALNPAC